MTYLSPIETTELPTRTEFQTELAGIQVRFDRLDSQLTEVNKRIDRVLLTMVAGMFVILAAIVSTGLLY